MIASRSRRLGAVALSAALAAATFAPVAAEAGWRHRGGGGNGGAVAAAGILGVIAGAAIASSAARADEEPECVIETRRTETPSGKIIVKKVRVCE